jgi:hypothetical protein
LGSCIAEQVAWPQSTEPLIGAQPKEILQIQVINPNFAGNGDPKNDSASPIADTSSRFRRE